MRFFDIFTVGYKLWHTFCISRSAGEKNFWAIGTCWLLNCNCGLSMNTFQTTAASSPTLATSVFGALETQQQGVL
jgi:hypothetical protein